MGQPENWELRNEGGSRDETYAEDLDEIYPAASCDDLVLVVIPVFEKYRVQLEDSLRLLGRKQELDGSNTGVLARQRQWVRPVVYVRPDVEAPIACREYVLSPT